MMEVNGRKVWICLAKGSSGKYTGYFSSVVESINVHVMNFVACPGAQVYWWLRRRGCLAEDVNRMVCHCFTLDQQQKITKSKYISDKGYAVLDEATSDNIINAVAGEGIFDATLGLSEKERRIATASKGHNASAIMFGEAKEGAVKVHNFSSSTSITTIHSKNVDNTRSVATQKMLAKTVFSMATSKVISDGSDEEEMDEDKGSNYKAGSAKKPEVVIQGMQMLTRGHRKNKSSVSEQEEESAEDSTIHDHEEAAQLTKNMNAATAKLNLLLLDGDQGTEDDNKKFNDAIDREDSINPYSNDEEGKDFLEDDLSVHQEDFTLGEDYDTASEVSSGLFNAIHSNQFEEPDTFKQFLWNVAGPSPGSIIICLDLLKDDLEADKAGLPANFNRMPAKLLKLMVQEAGKDRGEQIKFIAEILEALKQINQSNFHDEASSLDEGTGQEASKTQGSLPRAHKASPREKAAVEPAITSGRDKEGAQSPSMATTG
jgi:hypothetical protein